MTASKLLAFGKYLLLTVGIAIIGGMAFLYSGIYPMGADVPHNALTYWALETMRERSIVRVASNIEVPDDLDTSSRLLRGGADYNDMCASCHLTPSKKQSDFTLGLYPSPPNLAASGSEEGHGNHDHGGELYTQQRQFWIIKHGIKASGMPAWGPGHDDERIWDMVAFLKRLPELTPQQYQILTARGDNSSGHGH
tara:strand:- start:3032 stop:3616 length:585 start_codon:yes stop_codon:yes gene_type:complete